MEEKILQALEGLNKRFDTMEERFDKLEGRFDVLEGRFDVLEERFDVLEERFDKLEERFDKLEGRFDKLEGRFDSLEIQVQENTQILKALEHSAQVNKAEHDKMNIEIAKFVGALKSVKSAVSAVEKITANNWNEIIELKETKAI